MANNSLAGVAFIARLPGNATFLLLSLLPVYLLALPVEGQEYWLNAPNTGSKIFTILFTDVQNGRAISAEGEVLVTSNKGGSWYLKTNSITNKNEAINSFLWKAEIYCSVMQTTDGGQTWVPYDKDMQEHFCGVYLKDPNSGYRVASDFLSKATKVIISVYENDEMNLLLNHPQQCTEYYRSQDEGWALGWCVKYFNYNSFAKIKDR